MGKPDYTGKRVYMGIDVHKKTYACVSILLCKMWIKNKLEEVKQSNFPRSFCYTLEHYAEQWLRLTDDLVKIKKDLLAMQSEKERVLLEIYKSAPGVGDITALKLKAVFSSKTNDRFLSCNNFSNSFRGHFSITCNIVLQ